MKRIILLAFVILVTKVANTQIKGITESGDEVYLYDNGTWRYVDDSTHQVVEIFSQRYEFRKEEKSSFMVKSKKLNIGIWINPKRWSFSKPANEDVTEFIFQRKGEDLYAMLISEKISIPIESLVDIAFQNASSVASDMKILRKEYRKVNGLSVLMMKMQGTLQGVKFTYFGYYYSNSNGTMQLLSYCGANLFDEYEDDIEVFLNGLVEW